MHSERGEQGLRMADRAVADSRRNPEALYYQGLARVELNNTEGAIDALEEALKGDPQYRQFLLSDPDLVALRETERFKQVLASGTQ